MSDYVKLNDIVTIIGGGTPSKSEPSYWDNGNIRWATVSDMNVHTIVDTELSVTNKGLKKKSSTNIVSKDAIVIATKVGLGKVCFLSADTSINQDLKGLFPKPELTTKEYLYYFFRSIENYLIDNGTGSTVKGVKLDFVKNIDIPLPSLPEQQRIVSNLDKLFEKIDKAIALHQKNMDEADVFMGSVLNDVFGELEERYEGVELTKYVNFNGGSQPPKSEFSDIELDGYVRLIQVRDYKSDKHIIYVNKNSVRKFCAKNDVMIGRYGPPVFQILRGIDGAYNVALMKAEPNEDFLSKDFLFKFLQNPNVQNYIVGLSQRSAGQSGVNKEALEKYPTSLPPLQTQQKVVQYLDETSTKIEKAKVIQKEKMDSLKALKASILDKDFRGDL